ncbi:MAG: polysaccharide biosynthesis protein, partial [Actinobacteria bacterium]
MTIASLLRVDFAVSRLDARGQLLVLAVVIGVHLTVAGASGLYAHRWRYGSFDEVAALARSTTITTAVVFIIDLVASHPRMVPLTAVVAGGIVALVAMAGIRYVTRLAHERGRRPSGAGVQRVLVFGAGEGGAQVVAAMLRDPDSAYLPVALLDDAPDRQRLSIMGVAVVGTRADIARA